MRDAKNSNVFLKKSLWPYSQLWIRLSRITDHGSRITDHGSRITDHGSRITDHGSRITDHNLWEHPWLSEVKRLSRRFP